jgi:hypothetical protein
MLEGLSDAYSGQQSLSQLFIKLGIETGVSDKACEMAGKGGRNLLISAPPPLRTKDPFRQPPQPRSIRDHFY